jgi:hypothetical protein
MSSPDDVRANGQGTRIYYFFGELEQFINLVRATANSRAGRSLLNKEPMRHYFAIGVADG